MDDVDHELVSSGLAGFTASDSSEGLFSVLAVLSVVSVFFRETPNSKGASITVGLYEAKPPKHKN